MQIFEMGLLILAAYAGGRLAHKLKIGEVVGQIIGGVLVGPHFLELLYKAILHFDPSRNSVLFTPIYHFYDSRFAEYSEVLESYHFFVFLFLGIIAFSIGEELHRDRLRQVGLGPVLICILQALLTFLLGFLGFWLIFDFSLINSLLIGSIGIATAPALTFVLMNKLKIEGRLKNILANIVVLDDVIEVIFFSVFFGIAIVMQKGESLSGIHLAAGIAEELFFAVLIGVVIFLILKFTIRKKLPAEEAGEQGEDFLSRVMSAHPTPSVEILLVITGIVAIGISVAIEFDLPFLITAVVAGFLVSNFHSHALFDSLKIENVMPLFNLLFFAIIGSSVRVESFSLESLPFVLGYIVLRSGGKLFGTWAGCRLTGQDNKITACLPKLMLPQAGMAAVETILVATVLAESGGEVLFNTIIPALVVFELVGASMSEKTLIKWKNWVVGEKEALVRPGKDGGDLSLSGLVNGRIVKLSSGNRKDAIAELGKYCADAKLVSESGIVVNPVSEREKLASTAIGEGVALPHCRLGNLDHTIAVAGYMEEAVDWSAPDGKAVDLVFLLLSPDERPEEHLKAMSTISLALMEPGFIEALKKSFEQGTGREFLEKGSVSV